REGEISIRFKIVAGQLDQCAGILFNLKENGDYLTVRFNGMEDNVVLWTFNKGVRKFVKRGTENVPLSKNQWQTLQISVHGTDLKVSLIGKQLLDYTLLEAVACKVGVWSKTDSVSFFDDFTVSRLFFFAPAERSGDCALDLFSVLCCSQCLRGN